MGQTPAEIIADECLAVRIRLLSRVVTNIYDEALRPLGVTASQINILVVVSVLGPLAPGRVGTSLHMEKSTVSRNVERMRARGWLAAAPGDDGRSLSLSATARGRRLLERALPLWREAQGRTRSVLGAPGASALRDSADRLLAGAIGR